MEMIMTTDLETALPAEIGFNFDELKQELTDALHHYNTLVVTEDAIQEAKIDRAKLRKLKEAIDTRRKEVKRECERPYKAFEAKVKELTALIDAPVEAIDKQIKAFEDREKEQKLSEIQAAYDNLVPATIKEVIPLNRILDPKWLNKTTSMKSITEAIQTIAKRTNVDITFLEAAVDPKYLTAVRSEYIATLDIDKAMDQRDKLVAAEAAFQQREAARAAYQPPVEKAAPAAVQEPAMVPAPQPHKEEKVYALRLEFQLTMRQADALKAFLITNHINYMKI